MLKARSSKRKTLISPCAWDNIYAYPEMWKIVIVPPLTSITIFFNCCPSFDQNHVLILLCHPIDLVFQLVIEKCCPFPGLEEVKKHVKKGNQTTCILRCEHVKKRERVSAFKKNKTLKNRELVFSRFFQATRILDWSSRSDNFLWVNCKLKFFFYSDLIRIPSHADN